MKNVFYCVVSAMAVIMFLLWFDMWSRCGELEAQLATDRFFYEQKFSEYEKEIRLLKTDVHILQYGFEDE